MAIPILQTKLYIPPPPPKFVPRARLIERLNEGLYRKITLIAAQAGAGKTTLVSGWLDQLDQDMAWLSLDEADSDPARFWLYVIAALQTVRPDLGRAAQTALEAPIAPAYETLLTSLINEIAASSDRLIFVLDDYHLVGAAEIHQTLNFLLDHLPPPLHLVVLTREDPPLPLARLRVQQQMTEIRISDLRFTSHEAQQFLNQTMGLALHSNEIETLVRRTEGWVAGLQMAALSLQNLTGAARFIERFAGDDRYLVDYLMAEVLEHQPSDLRRFLLQTAILRRFSVSLCNAVTGQANSRAILTQLEDANLFLVSLDNRREWYRYHRLFCDLLRYQLQEEYEPAALRALHRCAASWHVAHDNIVEAVHHYLAAEEFVATADLIEPIGIDWIVKGQLRQMLDWLALFPADFLRTRPLLCVLRAWALNVTGQAAEVEQYLADAEQALSNAPSAQRREVRGLISTVRSYLARNRNEMVQSMQLLRRALADLSDDSLLVRSTVNLNLGFNYTIVGELALADQALAAAIAEGRRCQATYVTLIAMAVRANGYVAQGKLDAAKRLYQETIDWGLDQNGGQPFPPAGYAYAGLGQVLYEQNDRIAAEWDLLQAVRCGEQIGDWSMIRRGLLPLAWTKQTQGDSEEAHSLWQRALSVVQRAESDRLVAQLMVHRVRLWLAREHPAGSESSDGGASLAAAEDWAETYSQRRSDPRGYPETLAQMTLAWLDFVQGRTAQALSRLELLAQVAKAGGHGDNLIKILALLALAHADLGDQPAAFECMQRALDLAASQGYVRTFIDLGQPMHRLLQDMAALEIAPDYVVGLLHAFAVEKNVAARADDPVNRESAQPDAEAATASAMSMSSPSLLPLRVEPLNQRERQILGLMAARLSNQQIADELYLSINTVKWHARNLYAKLGVSSRVQAVDRARELHIL